MGSERIDLADLLRKFCHRRMMFTGSDRFDYSAAFLNGFFQSDLEAGKEFAEFLEWCSRKMQVSGNRGWMAMIRDQYDSDEEAFEALPQLFEEFRLSKRLKGNVERESEGNPTSE